MKVLFIIVTFNAMKWVDRCLGSISGKDAFIYDNASSDGTAAYIREHYPEVVLKESEENAGFTKGNNEGFAYALENGYDYVYLLNQDAWIMEDTLDILLKASSDHPDCGILSPMQYQGDGVTLDCNFSKLYASGKEVGDLVEVQRVMAAHWLIPVSALRNVGTFAEIFPLYGQDDNLCHRMKAKGYRTVIVPSAKAIHDRGQRVEDNDRLILRNYYMGSIVRLCNPCKSLILQWINVFMFTIVKSIKYLSLKPFALFGKMLSMGKEIKATRKL